MGNQIFNEITQQNDLIDDIDDRVENVNQRLINTNDNIAVVTKKDRTCGYWIIILILAIAILVVIFAYSVHLPPCIIAILSLQLRKGEVTSVVVVPDGRQQFNVWDFE